MLVAEAVGRALGALGENVVFGLIGSGNLAVTNALRGGGAPVHSARHECGAICMADGYARVTGRLAACSVHQGPGLTNAVTGLTEAAESRTPLIVLAAGRPPRRCGGTSASTRRAASTRSGRWPSASTVRPPRWPTSRGRVRRARVERRAVVLMLPLDVQALPARRLARRSPRARAGATAARRGPPWRAADGARRCTRGPAIIAGRGAVLADAGARAAALGERPGALLATTAVANGLFAGDPFALGISGGFASPLAARLLRRGRRRASPSVPR